jgi:hypothetical protein
MSILKNGEQEGKIDPIWGLALVGGQRIYRKGVEGEYGGNIRYSCMKMEN